MRRKIFLHIGTYKTGSTSIQRFLLDHAGQLQQQGIALYRGMFSEENHTELYVASLRYERDSFAKLGICKHIAFNADFTRQVADRVRSFFDGCQEYAVVFTAEGLSLLRYEDEIARLSTILDARHADVKVIVYLRNKADFLRSYTNQLLKVPGRTPSSDRASALYVEPDTWLTDYDSLVATFDRGFGAENVVVLDYDHLMSREGNVIPSFLRELGVDDLSESDTESYFLNTSKKKDARRPARRWHERMARAWRKWSQQRAA